MSLSALWILCWPMKYGSWVICSLCQWKQTPPEYTNNIMKAISPWYIHTCIYQIKDPWYCCNTVELCEAVRKGQICTNSSQFHQQWPENLQRFVTLCVWPAALGEKAASYLFIYLFLTEGKGDSTLRDQIQGGLCSFIAKICLKQMKRWEHSIPFLSFPLEE